VWRLAAMTGLRRGELVALRWEDIDLAGARLVVSRAWIETGSGMVESQPKSKRSRAVDLDTKTVASLVRHQAQQVCEREEWGQGYANNDLVVSWQDGSPIRPSALSSMFRSVVRGAGLRAIRLHDLRHTHATLALQAGVPITVVTERLGHHSPAFTLAQYAHAMPGMQALAAARVADLVHRRNHGDGE
jgi:integrase